TPFNVTVTAQDPYGNTASGYRGTAHFSSSDPPATLPADYTFAASDNGGPTFSGLVLRAAGTRSVTSTAPTLTGIAAVSVVAAAADHHALPTSPARPSSALTPFNVTVTALDPYGNTATGYRGTAHFSSSDPAATLPADYA